MNRWCSGRGRGVRRSAWVVVAGVFLAFPGTAAAHSAAPTVALDFRLTLSKATRGLHGVDVALVDGDRGLRVRADPDATLVVRGDLGEPVVRFDARGLWVNRNSPTAAADRLVHGALSSSGVSWVLRSRHHSLRWHEHRLAPPRTARPGVVGRWAVPVLLNGTPRSIGGTFVRVPRPHWWIWALAALALAAGTALVARLMPRTRPRLLIVLGGLASLGALASGISFGTADEISGSSPWIEVGAVGLLLALGVYAAARRHRGWRVWIGSLIGIVSVAFSLGALSVFGHGYVISTLPATVTRFCVLFAVVGGAATSGLAIMVEFDSAAAHVARGRRPMRPAGAKRAQPKQGAR